MGLKMRLQHSRTHAPLFDATRMTANMERAYEAMMSRYHRGLAPDHIRIAGT
jgi:predicted O-linked N-acetylglucosamine transferase (SPINDLY family)